MKDGVIPGYTQVLAIVVMDIALLLYRRIDF